MKKSNNPINKWTKRERRILIAALIILPFFYPFLLVWFAHGQLDETYQKARERKLPELYRSIAKPDGICPSDINKLKDEAYRLKGASVGSLPRASRSKLKSLRILEDFDFLPLFGRGLALWSQLAKTIKVLHPVWKNPEKECQQAGKNLHKAAADLEAALDRYGQTRVLMWVILYVWLVAEVFGWIVVIWFTRRYFRERAAAKASSSSK